MYLEISSSANSVFYRISLSEHQLQYLSRLQYAVYVQVPPALLYNLLSEQNSFLVDGI